MKPVERKGPGRKSNYTKVIGEQICARVAEGENLRSICTDLGIKWRAVYRWIKTNEAFAEAYQLARDVGEDAIASECLEIADNGRNDWMERQDDKGGPGWVFNGENVQRSKLRVETRLKLLAKWNPKRWGDRITHAGDANAPVQLVLNGSDVHG